MTLTDGTKLTPALSVGAFADDAGARGAVHQGRPGRRSCGGRVAGRPATWQQAFYARDLAGTVVLVGVPTPVRRFEMPLVDFFSHGGSLKSSWYGDCLPERDFPTLVNLYLQERLPLEKFVSERISLGDIEDAFNKMHTGEVLRPVVIL
jgi:S-(hydroxymethyl)mycothiol dehydrogenase